jgi:hypothetical protein
MYLYLQGLAQLPDPMPQPVIPDKTPERMPTNPLVPKPYCPELNTVKSDVCFNYEPSEISVSRTAAGHLNSDVVFFIPVAPPDSITKCGYLIIRDFGVDWRHVKLAARNEQLFKDMLKRFETDKTLLLRIVGYSDCAGAERNNFLLRRGRARNIFRLLGPKARARVMSVTAAPANTYLTSNSTVASRAHNRAVVIEFIVNGTQTI